MEVIKFTNSLEVLRVTESINSGFFKVSSNILQQEKSAKINSPFRELKVKELGRPRKRGRSINFVNEGSDSSDFQHLSEASDESEVEEFAEDTMESDALLKTLTKETVMEGSLEYRWKMNQLELNGRWGMDVQNDDDRFSYLLREVGEKVDVHYESTVVYLCKANMAPLLKTENDAIFQQILNMLSNEYSGFFKVKTAPVLDRFVLKLSGKQMKAKVIGKGENEYGGFELSGVFVFRSEFFPDGDTVQLEDFTLKLKYM